MANLVVRYTRWLIRWRWAVVLVMVGLGVAGSSGLRDISYSGDYRIFFDAQNPDLLAHETMERTYVAADTVLFVVRPRDGSTILTPERLAALWRLADETWQIPYVLRVDSLPTYQHTHAEDDDLIVEYLVDDPDAIDAQRAAFIGEVALSEPSLRGRFLSEDTSTSAIVATLQMPGDGSGVQVKVTAKAREIAEAFRAAHPDLRLATAGHVVMANTFFTVTQSDMFTLFPIMFGLLLLTMLVFLRSVAGAIVSIVVVILSVGVAMGPMFMFFGVEMTPISGQAPTIILTVAIADAIHMLVTMVKEMGRGRTRHEAVVESMRINFQPVMLTSLTTAIGFLSLNFSDTPPFRDLGTMAAVGAAMAWVFSVTLLPALMASVPIGKRTESAFEQRAMFGIAETVIANPGRVMALLILITGISVALVPTLEVNDKFVEYLSKNVEFRKDSDFISEHLPGIYDIAFSLESGSEGGIAEPDYLARVEQFANWLEDQPEVVHVTHFADVMKRLNRNMNGDDPAYYRVPESREMAAQYLLLYEMSLPYGLDLNNQINVPKSATRVQATLDNVSSAEMRSLKRRAEQWLVDNSPEEMRSLGSGITIIFAYLTQRNMVSMSIGTGLAILLISICLVVALRSFKMGLISLLPNFLPPLIAFGVWTVVDGVIGQFAAMVTAVALGLIVDFTVHFLSKYLRARREQGLSAEDSIRYAFRTVGSALWISAFVLIAGFSVLTASDFLMNANLGLFVAIIIAVALVVDFLLLPAILMLTDRKATEPSSAPVAAPAK